MKEKEDLEKNIYDFDLESLRGNMSTAARRDIIWWNHQRKYYGKPNATEEEILLLQNKPMLIFY
jgi:hypothetical protein